MEGKVGLRIASVAQISCKKACWVGGRVEGRESRVKDCLQQSIKCQIGWMDGKAGLQQSKTLLLN